MRDTVIIWLEISLIKKMLVTSTGKKYLRLQFF